jgi:hypothetical protein
MTSKVDRFKMRLVYRACKRSLGLEIPLFFFLLKMIKFRCPMSWHQLHSLTGTIKLFFMMSINATQGGVVNYAAKTIKLLTSVIHIMVLKPCPFIADEHTPLKSNICDLGWNLPELSPIL